MNHLQVIIASAGSGGLFRALAPWLVTLIVLVIVGWIVVMMLRRMMTGDDDGPNEGFTLHDLRQLRAAGKISEEEFDRAREAIIGAVQRAAQPEDEAKSTDSDVE